MASERLDAISLEEAEQGNAHEIIIKRWHELLKGTDFAPIDVHTPMWLWKRGKFEAEIKKNRLTEKRL